MAGVELFGYSRFNPVNAALFIFGQYSLVVAVFNLLPVRGLDGAMAWRIIPEAIKRLRGQKAKKASAGRYGSY
jgi:Zn-dependent protease